MSMVRVRFAPSPTGYLHIGGVRTALFNYLYARSQNGKFLVRIEDTDRQRFEPEFEKEIIDSLEWLGFKSDEAIIRQSERLERYQEVTQELLARGLAYKEETDGKEAVRFKIPPDTKAIFHDVVRGAVEFDTSLFDDLVIQKSDGYPTYHWACVIDDHDMEISHVIRGDDHLSNTPRQILLYQAMGWKPPKYAHLPLILGDDGSPLSKRHGAVALSTFKEKGYLPEALLNYLALLGWGEQGNQEIFTLEQLIKKFSLKRVNKAGARFNKEKLDWLNAQHIKQLPEEKYVEQITSALPEQVKQFEPEVWRKLILLFRTRIKSYPDLKNAASYCFGDVRPYDPEKVQTWLKRSEVGDALQQWVEKAKGIENFGQHELLEQMTRELAAKDNLEAKDLIHPLRYAISGETVTPGLFELMSVLGKDTCVNRLQSLLQVASSDR